LEQAGEITSATPAAKEASTTRTPLPSSLRKGTHS
jgi:hypothetical protein